jgi:hypothetical protein
MSILSSIVNQQDVPQAPWKPGHITKNMVQRQEVSQVQGGSRYITNGVLSQQKVAQWKSGDAEDADEENEFWIRSDLDML